MTEPKNPTNPRTVIEISDASFSYGRRPLFSGVNMAIHSRDYVALVGANGTGKSTLFRILLGELDATGGTVRLENEPIRLGKNTGKIGYIPQVGFQPDMDFPATVSEMVMTNLYSEIGFFGRIKKAHKIKVREALEMTGMQKYASTPMNRLSGGMRQRVLLSRVLVNQPEILLLDEPTVGVDEESITSLLCLLSQLNKNQGITILMITHDLKRVAPYVNRVFCMGERSVVELTPEQVAIEMSSSHQHPEDEQDCHCCEEHQRTWK